MIDKKKKDEIMLDLELKGITPNGLYPQAERKADKEKEETTGKNETKSHETEERSDITKNEVEVKPESRSITRRFLFNTTKVAAAVLLATQLPRIIRFIDKL